jgi:tetratricopeptide (TPR) repeat protein
VTSPCRNPAAVALLIACAVLSTASPGNARPSLWERARRPVAAREAELLPQLERILDARELSYREPSVTRDIARAAVARSDLSGIRSPSDPRLACVMADALIIADIGREHDARRLLEGALETLPVGPLRADSLRRLGVVLAVLAEPLRSRQAYTEALELEVSPRERANLYYNRAEASLELDELEAASADYRRSIALAVEPDVLALSRYGLAVALERLGDLPAAFTELDAALAIMLPFPAYPAPDPLELPGVFFVPAYERYYLEALRAMARLRHAEDRAERLVEASVAVDAWDAYLAAAPSSVRYRKNAEAHRRRVAETVKVPSAPPVTSRKPTPR